MVHKAEKWVPCSTYGSFFKKFFVPILYFSKIFLHAHEPGIYMYVIISWGHVLGTAPKSQTMSF